MSMLKNNYFKQNVTFECAARSPQTANPCPMDFPDFFVPIAITSNPFCIAGHIYDCIFFGLHDCVNDFHALKVQLKSIFSFE